MGEYASLLGATGPLARAVEGFEPRHEQQVMADHVGEAIADRSVLAVEAGTGTGKTFAYLVPAILSGRHVILSTGTRTLQDQLFHRDLPMVSAAIGRPARVALLKGRANYLCRHRLDMADQAQALPGMEPPSAKTLARIRAWSQGTRSGDLSELDGLSDSDPAWAAVTSTRDNCLGQDCPQFSYCHVVQARREAQAADIVVVNHHLLLADLAMKEEGFGELLPGTDAVILDEAHQVPETAAQFFGLNVSSRQATALIRDALAELTRSGLVNPGIREELFAVEQSLASAHSALRGLPERIDWTAAPDAFIESLDAAAVLLDRLARAIDNGGDEAGLKALKRRAEDLARVIVELLDAGEDRGVRWIESTPRAFTASFTPFEVADRLREFMQARPCAWIFTSATLAVGDDFRHFLERVGAPDARTLRIDSPFDYEQQALLYLPKGLPDPSDRTHTTAVLQTAMPLIEAAGGRTFLLFTSYRALNEAAALLRARIGFTDRYPLLVQGEAPRDSLLRRFRESGEAVLLGTSSFWEGVDVRGHALAVVVIDKLPFASPDDPLLKARLEGIKRSGGNGFMDFQVPQAALALKQGFGRLIRDREDFGVVAICDPRLQTRGYGRTFIGALPPARIVHDGAEAASFLRKRLKAAGIRVPAVEAT
ncbi:MAG: ATP-dependent DNA helicase [Gammaproteobacteria bacterium]|nr:ATP-dependent DNA helicase [Gammaproteobacteria bacterium]